MTPGCHLPHCSFCCSSPTSPLAPPAVSPPNSHLTPRHPFQTPPSASAAAVSPVMSSCIPKQHTSELLLLLHPSLLLVLTEDHVSAASSPQSSPCFTFSSCCCSSPSVIFSSFPFTPHSHPTASTFDFLQASSLALPLHHHLPFLQLQSSQYDFICCSLLIPKHYLLLLGLFPPKQHLLLLLQASPTASASYPRASYFSPAASPPFIFSCSLLFFCFYILIISYCVFLCCSTQLLSNTLPPFSPAATLQI